MSVKALYHVLAVLYARTILGTRGHKNVTLQILQSDWTATIATNGTKPGIELLPNPPFIVRVGWKVSGS